ncbi:urease accessory protein UreD [Methylobacterium sp. J-067]|uniref:urease accessory protein UreD n=1 Tax=Methylobacterium sp. J-067 TaxID=2836648 RepID=UPI001FB8D399|nr:urease accessory protein UreD [Methylobacterium sp. J-067]MCJ2023213.1 urease accessory protein UreD [Methylobacterium sp. J-067]
MTYDDVSAPGPDLTMADPVRPVQPPSSRHVEARLTFARGGGTTVLGRQEVPYPFHITRAFRLQPDAPDLATLYLQSASGGLYRGDRLGLSVDVRAGARVHVTTQSATVVHNTGSAPARQATRLEIGPGAFLALDPDPLILFPGAALGLDTHVTLAEGARAIVTEGIAHHDPRGEGRPFAQLDIALTIADAGGRLRVAERGQIDGADWAARSSPLGTYRAYGSMLVLAAEGILPETGRLQAAADEAGCLGGMSPLPNGAGLGLRLLAPDGGRLSAGLQAAFAVAFTALAGTVPGRRRK